tara:strand:- start:42 stop:572 length:531 start_codon:yes stop_codon:yes gene_type:complete
MNISNFIETYKAPKKMCDEFINYFKKNKEYKNLGNSTDNNKKSTDVTFFNNSNNKNIKEFFKILSYCLQQYIDKYKINSYLNTNLNNNIQYYRPKEGYPTLHYERDKDVATRELVYMLYLNTVTDKGGTEFPYQNKILSAIKGNLIIWPADFTHPHRGIISPTQEKYIVTGWFDLV